jgi:uncharacterized YkwD family protein
MHFEKEAFFLIKKSLWIGTMLSFLLMGLVSCNNNDDQAFDNEREHRQEILGDRHNEMNRRAIFGRDERDIRDHNLDRNDRRNGYGINNQNRNNRNDRDNEYGFFNRNRNNGNDDRFDGLEISSNSTNVSSKDFPHTKAVLIQEAKFKYVKIDPNQIQKSLQGQIPIPPINFAVPVPQQRNQGQTVAPPPNTATPTAPAPTSRTAPKPAAPAPKPAAPAPTTKAPATGISQAAARVIELTNAQRRQHGLPDLKADTQLSGVAQKKSVDMKQNNYFSHTSPTYGSPFDMMRDFGVSYKTAGENIAQGQQTPELVVDAWMKSQGHRENILSAKYTHIGVGYESGGHHWTQMFIGK